MLSQFHAFSNLSCIHSWIVPSSHIRTYPIAPYQPCQGVAKTWGTLPFRWAQVLKKKFQLKGSVGGSFFHYSSPPATTCVCGAIIHSTSEFDPGWLVEFPDGSQLPAQHSLSTFRLYSFSRRLTMLYLFIWENNNGGGQECNKHRMIITKNSPNLAKKYILCEYKYIYEICLHSVSAAQWKADGRRTLRNEKGKKKCKTNSS